MYIFVPVTHFPPLFGGAKTADIYFFGKENLFSL